VRILNSDANPITIDAIPIHNLARSLLTIVESIQDPPSSESDRLAGLDVGIMLRLARAQVRSEIHTHRVLSSVSSMYCFR
jgi:hypothetical protein